MDTKTKFPLLVTVVMLFCMLLAGCAPVYIPSAEQTHLLDKKGETSFAAYTGINGVDVQAAYAFSDHFGVQAAGSFGKHEEKTDNDYQSHRYGEAGLQYHHGFGNGRFELMSGIGFGSGTAVDNYEFFDSPNQIRATGKYHKYYFQPNIGVESGVFEGGVALRLGHVVFTEFETTSDRYAKNRSATFFEPALFARLGWKNIKIEGQLGFSRPLNGDSEVGFDYEPGIFSLGLHLNFDTLTGQ